MSVITSTSGERFVKVSGIGPDRPGIIHHISHTIAVHGGNILLLRSMRVANDYAVTLIAAFTNDNAHGANEVIQKLRSDRPDDKQRSDHPDDKRQSDHADDKQPSGPDDGFVIRASEVDQYDRPNHVGTRYRVTVDGHDRTGIVESISYCFVRYGLNIDSVETESVFMPFQGFRTFSSEFWTRLPDDVDADGFASEVDQIASDNGLTSKMTRVE